MFHILSLLPLMYITVLSGPINMLPCTLFELLMCLKEKVKIYQVKQTKKIGMKQNCNLKAQMNTSA